MIEYNFGTRDLPDLSGRSNRLNYHPNNYEY